MPQEYWVASWTRNDIIAIYGWCGPWKGSHWIMDLKRNVVIYIIRRWLKMNKLSTDTELWELDKMIRCGPNEIENETDMKVANSLTTWRSQRARRAICRKSAQTFHLPLVKYEDEYSLCDWKSLPFYFGKNSEIWILDSNSWVAKNMNYP